MSCSHQQPMNSDKGDSVNEGGALLEAARQVKILEDGTVHVIYTSYAAYNHDQQLLKAAKMTHDQVANASSEGLRSQRIRQC